MSVRSYRDLRVWQRALDLVCAAYEVARRLPREETRALGAQLRRAAASIPANIAEGHTRRHRKEFLQFLAVAHASLAELETHLIIAQRVGLASAEATAPALALCDQLSRMLTTMRTRLGDPRFHPPDARRPPLDAPLDAQRPTPDAR